MECIGGFCRERRPLRCKIISRKNKTPFDLADEGHVRVFPQLKVFQFLRQPPHRPADGVTGTRHDEEIICESNVKQPAAVKDIIH
ncbi:MAG: hypothetical protein V7679_02110 [Parasphingorhabdus sp.]